MCAAYPYHVDQVHVGLDGQGRVLHQHQLGEGDGELRHLSEVDEDSFDLVGQRRVEQHQVLEVHAPTGHKETRYSAHQTN